MKQFLIRLCTFIFFSQAIFSFHTMLVTPRAAQRYENGTTWYCGESMSLTVGATVQQSRMRGVIEDQRPVRVRQQKAVSQHPRPVYAGPLVHCSAHQPTAEIFFENSSTTLNLVDTERLEKETTKFIDYAQTISEVDFVEEPEQANKVGELPPSRIEQRLQAFETSAHQHPYQRHVTLSQPAKELVKAARRTPEHFSICFGNDVQQLLHCELFNVVEKSAGLYQEYRHACVPIAQQCIEITKFAELGLQANWNGNITLGFQISDWCNLAIERTGQVARAIAGGVWDGVTDCPEAVIATALVGAIGGAAALNVLLVVSLIPITLQLIETGSKGFDLYLRSSTGDPQAEKDFDDFLQPIDEIISSATRLWRYAAWESVLNIVRRASAFGAEICLQRLTSGRVKAFFKNGRRAFEKAVKKGFSSKELRVFAVPGGPHVHLSKKDGNLFFKKGDNASQKIKNQIVQTGSKTLFNIKNFGDRKGFYIFGGKRVSVYYDPIQKKWWSKDITQHGGSCYKVFKQKRKYLEWDFDADEFGNKIIGKNKGPRGLIVEFFGA